MNRPPSSETARPLPRNAGLLGTTALLCGLGALAWTLQAPPAPNAPSGVTARTPLPDRAPQVFTAPQPGPSAPNAPAPSSAAAIEGALPALPAPDLKNDPQLAVLWRKGVLAQQQNKLAEAATAYRDLLRAQPRAFPAHVNLGLVLLRQKENAQAVWHLKRAIELAPHEVQPRLLLAQAYTALKRPRDAYTQWTQVATEAKAQSNLRTIYIQAAMTAGELAFSQLKDLAAAETWLRRANDALAGRDPRTALLLGQVLSARGKHREAAQVLEASAKLSSGETMLLSALAEEQWRSGDKTQTLVTLRALEKSTPASLNHGENLSRIRVLIARALAGQKQFEQAAATFQKALAVLPKDSPSRSSTQQLLAQTLAAKAEDEEKRGKLQDAATTWDEAASLFPDNPFAYAQRARLLERLGDAREALREYDRALKLAPRDPNLLLRAAILEEKTGNAANALAQWKALIEARPEYAPAYFNLARVSVKLRELPAQMKYLETQLGKNPDRRAAYDAVLEAGEKSGQSDLARDWVSAMAKKYPKSAAPRNALIAFDRNHPPARPDKTPTPAPSPAPASTPVLKSPTPPTNTAPVRSGAVPIAPPVPKPLITSPALPDGDEPDPAEHKE